jgi:lipoprotein-anchoring transpeptidase ErfK/SrfK/outer membrane protein assembly factor BamD (BamD/ComL family)
LVFLIVISVAGGIFLRVSIARKLTADLEKAEVLCAEEKYDDALQVFEKMQRKYPRFRNATVSYLHGVCLSNLGRAEEAEVLWKRVAGSKPDEKYYPASLYQLARLREIDGQYGKAIDEYERMLFEFEGSDIIPEIMLSLGNCYEQLKKWRDAREWYEAVLSSWQEGSLAVRAKKKLGDLNMKLIFSPYVTEDSIEYEAKVGDTLEKIANEHNTTVSLIRKANGLKRKILPLGKRLVITPGNFEISVDADKNILTLKLNGRFFKEYSVGTGKFGCTPIGSFKIVSKQVKPVWYAEDGIFPYGHSKNILGSRWMGIDKTGYGIHGTTQPETVGKHASAGCIRMHNKDVEELYVLATVGTPVVIIGTSVEN